MTYSDPLALSGYKTSYSVTRDGGLTDRQTAVLTLRPGMAVRLQSGSSVLLPVLWSTQIIWQRLHRPWHCRQ